MDLVLLVARLLLATVFAVAGLAKLADLAGSRRAMRDFGLPARLAALAGTLLPLAELAVAVALVARPSAWWGALGALALLLLFVAGIGVSLARGRRPDCHCFGQIHSAPAGWQTLARNGVLAAVAVVVLWQGQDDPGRSALAWLDGVSGGERVDLAAGVLGLVLLAAGGWVLAHLLGQNGRLLVRIEALEARFDAAGLAPVPAPAAPAAVPEPGLPVGAPAPTFALAGLHGETMTLDALRAAGKPVLLVFSDPNCGPCNTLLPDLGRWQNEQAAQLTVALLSRGAAEASRPKATEHGLTRILLQQDREVAQAYEANGTPAAVIVRPDGTIGSPLALGAEAIRALVARTVGAPAPVPATVPALVPTAPAPAPAPSGSANGGEAAAPPAPATPRVGDPAPALTFPNLDGRPMSVAGFRGHPTLVLFWNPGCGFCARMLDDLRAWEAKRPKGAPKLLIVSTGTVEANRAMGIHAPIVLDQGFEAGRAFGASGTPSAVLVDAQGRIASPLAAGAPGVLALARGEAPIPAGAPADGADDAAVPTAPSAPKVGDPAPALTLPDLDGRPVSLADLRGHPTLVLFWNLGCGFCAQMLSDLKAWEANRQEGAPRLLVVSTGTVEANRAMGLTSTVVLDPSFAAGTAFGTNGTPTAVLVDAEGRIASPIAAGDEAVLALANGEDPTRAGRGSNGAQAPVAPKFGDPAPALTLPDLDGTPVNLGDRRGQPTLVLFWNPGCGFCARMLDDLKAWEANAPAEGPELLVVSTGTAEANRALGLASTVVLDQGFSAGRTFGASGTPSAVLVDAEGRVASPVAAGAPAVFALARGEAPEPAAESGADAAPTPAAPPAPTIGDPAPAVDLPDLSGKKLSLAAFRGTPRLILFWNPGCGFCARMLDDLKAWEANPPKGAPKLLVVSTGTVEANRAMGLRSPVVLDQGFAVGGAFGASGTPSAVLVDPKGKIASEVAVGAPAVLALAGAERNQPVAS